MNRIKCFWLDALEEMRYYLRTYETEEDKNCPLTGSFHNATVFLCDGPAEYYERSGHKAIRCIDEPDDPPLVSYPTTCNCGFLFSQHAQRHVYHRQLFQRKDTNEKMTVEDAPAGAMWNAWFYGKYWQGEDGMSLMVKTPGGEWCVDGHASNCTKPDDEVHKCWCRHGIPPEITVDKVGNTCNAGAGSIAQKTYHGFLRNGYLEQC
jgi:hypothetical protein